MKQMSIIKSITYNNTTEENQDIRPAIEIISADESDVCQYISTWKDHQDEFTNGWSYAFASMLQVKFNGVIYIVPNFSYFICKIGESYFDVTGNVTSEYSNHAISWEDYKSINPIESARVIRYCIFK